MSMTERLDKDGLLVLNGLRELLNDYRRHVKDFDSVYVDLKKDRDEFYEEFGKIQAYFQISETETKHDLLVKIRERIGTVDFSERRVLINQERLDQLRQIEKQYLILLKHLKALAGVEV